MNSSSLPSSEHSHEKARHALAVIAALSLLLVSTAVWAADGTAGLSAVPSTRVEVPTGPARWRTDDAPRAAVQVEGRQPATARTPAGWSDPSTTRLSYVQWGSASNQASLGVSMGVSSLQPGNPAGLPWMPGVAAQPTSLRPELGLRWRTGWTGDRRVDVDAWSSYDATRGLPAADRRSYNARVELQFRDNSPRLGFDGSRGALGLQLSSNSQMLLRAKHGGPMVYYRAKW